MSIEGHAYIFGHISYFLVLLSFAVRKIFWLRLMAIIASIFTILYGYYLFESPLWIPIQWNILFIIINIIHISLILWEKRDINFQGDQKFLFENTFTNFTPGEFQKVFKLARPVDFKPESRLIDEGVNLNRLFVIVEGELEINSNGNKIINLKPGMFAGEMSFITRDKTRAQVICSKETKCYYWTHNQLRSFLERNPKQQSLFHRILGEQIIDELTKSSVKNLEQLS